MKGSTMERFCGCFDRLIKRTIDLVYSGKPTNEIDFSTLPSDYCRECDLPVDVERIELINQQIKLILPMYADAPVSGSASAKKAESELSGALPGLLLVEAARRLGVSLNDVNRHIRSGRLSLDASGKFVTQDSLNELQKLMSRS
jgi:hypothetical protein